MKMMRMIFRAERYAYASRTDRMETLSMLVRGFDITCSPTRRKPITEARARLHGELLKLEEIILHATREDFVAAIQAPGKWIGAFDFPFGQPKKFISDLKLPKRWSEYVAYFGRSGRKAFSERIAAYSDSRAEGARLLRRSTDVLARAQSPMKCKFIPVGLMFAEWAPVLLQSDLDIVPCRRRARCPRVAVEAYPKLVAKRWSTGTYKTDGGVTAGDRRRFRTQRAGIVEGLISKDVVKAYGFNLQLPRPLRESCVDDDSGDILDSICCAAQGAWAWLNRKGRFGIPFDVDKNEGWIVDPELQLALAKR